MDKMPECIIWLRCWHCGKKYDASDGYCCDPEMCDFCGKEVATKYFYGLDCCIGCFEELKNLRW
jgi:hypothetical protein